MSDIVSASRDAKHAKTWPFERNHAERARRRGGSAAWRRGWRGPLAFGVLTASLVALSPVAARAATAPSPTIAGAQAIQIGDVEQDAVGNEATDFWSVALNGGDQLAIDVTDDSVSTDGYRFELYDPTATDANFATAQWVTARTIAGSDSSQITIQAPHTGTFILAVCETPAEGTAGSCGTDATYSSMIPYSFTTARTAGPQPLGPAAAQMIAAAPALSLTPGTSEAGGGYNIDFWQAPLQKSEQLAIDLNASASGASADYRFELYPPGTTDASLALTPPVTTTSNHGTVPDTMTLTAPSSGTFLLAVCETGGAGVSDCGAADPLGGIGSLPASVDYPADPYTFATATKTTTTVTTTMTTAHPTTTTTTTTATTTQPTPTPPPALTPTPAPRPVPPRPATVVAPTRAQQRAKALAACKRLKNKHKRAKCIAKARKR